jgi:hypothetical protein
MAHSFYQLLGCGQFHLLFEPRGRTSGGRYTDSAGKPRNICNTRSRSVALGHGQLVDERPVLEVLCWPRARWVADSQRCLQVGGLRSRQEVSSKSE